MLNRLASLTMSTSVLKALLGKLDIKRRPPSIPIYCCSHYLLEFSDKILFRDVDLGAILSSLTSCCLRKDCLVYLNSVPVFITIAVLCVFPCSVIGWTFEATSVDSIESDLGCPSGVFFDNVTLTSMKPY